MHVRELERSAELVEARLPGLRPRCALILGSGWSAAAEALDLGARVPYAAIPAIGSPGVAGHAGELAAGSAHGLELLVFRGRRHWYEGDGWDPVAAPVYLARRLGATAILLTNACGSLRPDFAPGRIVRIADHVNAMGANPLIGPHDPFWGPRFPDQGQVYDPGMARLLDDAAAAVGEPLAAGVYVAVSGPTYETPAEARACRALGGDIVGMSTVPEAILARAAGLRVAALSCVANLAPGLGAGPLTHDEVLAAMQAAEGRMRALLLAFLARLAAATDAGGARSGAA